MPFSRKEFLLSLLVSTTAFLSSCKTGVDPTDPKPDKTYLVSATEIRSLSRQQVASQVQFLSPVLSYFVSYGIKVYKIVYNTQLPDGTAVKASGALLVPDSPNAVPMLAQHHGTIQSDSDAPSYFGSGSDAYTGGALFASQGYIMACPDYIGYGESKNQPHLYEHRESLATASLDMLRAAKEFIAQKSIKWDERLMVTGYSEGGFAAMSLLKKLEEEVPTEFTIVAATMGAGAYHKSAFMNYIINNETSGVASYNGLYLWVLQTYNNVYKLNRPMSYYLKEPYASQTNISIGGSLSRAFNDSFKQAVNNGTDKAFLDAVADNDVYDWKPKTPLRLYHGDADNLVFYFNSQDAVDAMKKRGAADVELETLRGRNHTTGIIDYLINTYDFFSKMKPQ